MGQRALLGYKNCIDYGTLSGGSWVDTPTVNLNNILDIQPQTVTRSTNLDPASTQVTITLDKQRLIDVCNIVNHNFSDMAQVKISFFADPDDSVPQWTTGDVRYIDRAPWGSIPYGSEYWWTGYIGVDPDIKPFVENNFIIMADQIKCQKILVEIYDPTNEYGYVEFGRLQFMQIVDLSNCELEYGAGVSLDNNTTSQKSESGATYFTRRSNFRTATFNLSGLSDLDGFQTLFNFEQYVGSDREVIFIWDLEDTALMKASRSFAGFIRAATKAEAIYFNSSAKSYTIEERL